MDSYHARSGSLGTHSVLCDRSCQLGIIACETILSAENPILRAHLPARLRLSDAERSTLAEIDTRPDRKALQEIARVAKPDTLLALVSATGGTQVRRLSPARLSWPTQDITRSADAGGPDGAREPRLEIGPHRGVPANLGPAISDRTVGTIPAPAQPRASTGAESHDEREGVHPVAPGRARRSRLLVRS
jgi:hypothetical protein